jgi:hypothetical protein
MIIKCKECQVDVSDSAVSCPNCGISFPGISDEDGAKIEKDSRYRGWLSIPAVLFFVPIFAVMYNVFTGHDAVAKEVFLVWWPAIAFGVWLYVVGEIIRGISNWYNERSIDKTKRANPGIKHNKKEKTFSFEKVKDLADIDPVEGGIIKECRYQTITDNSQFPRKARTNKGTNERLGPGTGCRDVNSLEKGQIVTVYNVFEWCGCSWARVSNWHNPIVYGEVPGHVHMQQAKVARWINMEDLERVDEVDA